MMRLLFVLLLSASLGVSLTPYAVEGAVIQRNKNKINLNRLLKEVAKKYPAAEYLTALDAAPELARAKDQALGDLAKIFSVRIEDDSVFNQNVVPDGTAKENADYLSRSVVTSSQLEIDGAEIAEIWFDKKENLYYALAVLNRQDAVRRWRRSAQLLNRDIQTLTEDAAPYDMILSLLERKKHIAEYNILAHRLRVLEPSKSHTQIRDDTDALVREQAGRFSLVVQGADDDLVSLARTTLRKRGMRVVSSGGNLRLDILADAEQNSRHDDWFILRQQLIIKVFYAHLSPREVRWNLREESLNSQKAEERMRLARYNKIKNDLFTDIIKTLSDDNNIL